MIITEEVEVQVDLSDHWEAVSEYVIDKLSDSDLLDELEVRNLKVSLDKLKELLEKQDVPKEIIALIDKWEHMNIIDEAELLIKIS